MSTTYFVDIDNGLDGNVGYDMDFALKTISTAMTLCVAGDIIFILATEATTIVDEAVVIAKNNISIRGENSRVEIKPATSGSPSVLITGDSASLKTLTIGVSAGGTDNGITVSGSLDSMIEDVRIENATGYGIDIDAGSVGTHILLDVTFNGSTLGDTRDLGTDTYTAASHVAPSAATIADAVWDETLADHVIAGSAGEALGNVDASQLSVEHAVYNDKVVFDPTNSTGLASSGTTFPSGTSLEPSLTLADVITICNARGFNLIQVKQSATITSTPSVDNFHFEGDNRSATILTFVAADTGDTSYNHIHLEGGMSGGADINSCSIGSITGVGCTVNETTIAETLISNSIVLRADNNQPFSMVNCGSINNAQVVLDLNGTTGNIAILNYTDRIRIINMTAALSIHVSSAAGCELTIDASCTAVTLFEVHGNVNIINQSNLTIDDDTTHALIWEQPTSVIVPGSMGQLVNYLGYVDKQVHFDGDALNGGTGTQLLPFNTLADTVDYAETNNIKDLIIHSDIIIDRNLKNFRITGIGVPEVDANGNDLLNSEFHRVKFKGLYTNPIILQESVLLTGAYLNGFFENCSIVGDVICVDGSNNFVKNCASGIPGPGRPSISMSATGTTKLSLRGYQGGITIKDCNAATDEVTVSLNPGSATFDSSCTNGVMVARGVGTFVDASAGATVTDETVSQDTIASSVRTELTTELANIDATVSSRATQVDITNVLSVVDDIIKYQRNRTKIDKNAFTLTIYDDDGSTPLKVFDLKDDSGVASITSIFERLPQ